jgi:hypothetical protein
MEEMDWPASLECYVQKSEEADGIGRSGFDGYPEGGDCEGERRPVGIDINIDTKQ